MERLYRDFILVALLFLVVTFVLNVAPLLRCNLQEIGEKNKHIQCVNKNNVRIYEHEVNKRGKSEPASVWDVDADDDRILKQMEYKPKVKGDKKYIIAISGSGDFDEPMGNEKFVKEGCNFQNCELGRNLGKEIIPDARIFNIMISPGDLAYFSRTPDQIWILYILEGPLATPDYSLLGDVFNWTATYRRDSTIVTPYEKWIPFKNNSMPIKKNYAKGKRKKCAIFVSNCDTSNKRLDYVKELQKHIPVDIYGGCGDKTCDRSDGKRCFNMLKRDYKFYLAFENSNCKDYITEKFFQQGLMYDTLPVVMGAHPDEYRQVAPPNSYLHVENFTSPQELATYLHKLDKYDELYNKYFEWKGTGGFINTKFWCRLCALLNDPHKPRLSIPDIQSWWRPSRVCIRGNQHWINK